MRLWDKKITDGAVCFIGYFLKWLLLNVLDSSLSYDFAVFAKFNGSQMESHVFNYVLDIVQPLFNFNQSCFKLPNRLGLTAFMLCSKIFEADKELLIKECEKIIGW